MNVWCGAGIPHDQDLRPEQEEAGGLQRTEDCRRHGRGNLGQKYSSSFFS